MYAYIYIDRYIYPYAYMKVGVFVGLCFFVQQRSNQKKVKIRKTTCVLNPFGASIIKKSLVIINSVLILNNIGTDITFNVLILDYILYNIIKQSHFLIITGIYITQMELAPLMFSSIMV